MKSIQLTQRSFVELESELSELQKELRDAQESLRVTRPVDTNPKIKWRNDPRIRKIKSEIEVLKATEYRNANTNMLNLDINPKQQVKLLNYKL